MFLFPKGALGGMGQQGDPGLPGYEVSSYDVIKLLHVFKVTEQLLYHSSTHCRTSSITCPNGGGDAKLTLQAQTEMNETW